VLGGEKLVDGWSSLKLSHDSSQSGPVVMNLGFFHATLPPFVIEEVEHIVERLLRIIQHIGECPALTVLKKVATGDGCGTHLWGSTVRVVAVS
jgi:hypothetical protein